ncbi:MAG: glycosyltransferase [Verrucomicrobia bacterium]|nr:glycosyltransferase [Verrucomicrobiota bacterium]
MVSVVIPVYNAAASLEPAVCSIIGQTLEDWELLIIDDGSTDDSASIAAAWAKADPRIHLLPRPHEGIVSALNYGLEHADGRYIARMDADDISMCDRLARQAEYLERRRATGLVGCRVAYGGDPRRNQGYALHVAWINSLSTPESIQLNRFVESPFAHPSVMFRRELLDLSGGYRDGGYPEDYELWLRWLSAGVQMERLPRTLLIWNDPPGRLSRTAPRYSLEAFYRVKARYLAPLIRETAAGREVWIWGAGRTTRQRAKHLFDYGVSPAGYIDIDPRKIGQVIADRPVVAPSSMPGPGAALVIGYVGRRGARRQIRGELDARGFVEGRDFWMAA